MPVSVWSSTASTVACAARPRGIGREQRLDQFQVAHRHRVEHHGIGAVVEGGPVQVIERGALRLAQVVQDGARRAHRRGPVAPGRSHRARAA